MRDDTLSCKLCIGELLQLWRKSICLCFNLLNPKGSIQHTKYRKFGQSWSCYPTKFHYRFLEFPKYMPLNYICSINNVNGAFHNTHPICFTLYEQINKDGLGFVFKHIWEQYRTFIGSGYLFIWHGMNVEIHQFTILFKYRIYF